MVKVTARQVIVIDDCITHMGKQKYTAACVTQCQVWLPCPCWLHSRAQHQARGAAEWQSCHGVQLLKPTIITTLDNLVLWCFNVCSFVYCHSQLIPSPYSVYCSNILCNILIKHEKIHVMIYLKHNSIHHKRNVDLKNLWVFIS